MENNILPKTIEECDQMIYRIQTLKAKLIQEKKDSFKIEDKIIYKNVNGKIVSIEHSYQNTLTVELDKLPIEYETSFSPITPRFRVNVADVNPR